MARTTPLRSLHDFGSVRAKDQATVQSVPDGMTFGAVVIGAWQAKNHASWGLTMAHGGSSWWSNGYGC